MMMSCRQPTPKIRPSRTGGAGMSEYYLEIHGVSKAFQAVQALDNVELRLRPGEIKCLAGENGCGKSTLIKIISGVYTPDSGEIIIKGKKYTSLTPMQSIAAGIQVIYQDFSLFPKYLW